MQCRKTQVTQWSTCFLLFSRHWNQDTSEENSHSWHLPNHWDLWEMAHLEGEGHSIYILKTPRYQDLPERSPNVIFSQNPGTGPCRAIPLEQLTKVEKESKCNRKKLKVLGIVPRGWSSDYEDSCWQLWRLLPAAMKIAAGSYEDCCQQQWR